MIREAAGVAVQVRLSAVARTAADSTARNLPVVMAKLAQLKDMRVASITRNNDDEKIMM